MEQQNPNQNKMERNFPFVNVSFFDKMYKKLVLSITEKLDSGNIFKLIMVLTFHISAFAFLIGLPVYFFIAAFGEPGFINGGFKGVLAFIIGLPVTLFTAWYGYGLLRKRAIQLNEENYSSILSFFFQSYIPKNIIVTGELYALILIMYSIPVMLMGMNFTGSGGFFDGIAFILGGLGVLIFAYAIKEVYLYGFNIALSIIKPLLVFAVAGGLATLFSGMFTAEIRDAEPIIFFFVAIVCIYIFFMLLKKHVFTQWHDK